MRPLLYDGRPFLAAQSSALGLTPYALRAAVAKGTVRRLLRGVYVDAAVADSRELRVAALALVLPAEGVAWGRTAAWLWGIDSFSPADRTLLRPECAVPHHMTRPAHRNVRVVERYLSAECRTRLGGVPVTTPLRTALDLARSLPRPMALAALDSFTHAGLVCVRELRRGVSMLAHHPGVVQARDLVALVEPLAESPGESWLRLRLLDAGFPRPTAQVRLLDQHGRQVYRLDLGYPEQRLAVEYDGRDWHGSPTQRAADERRRAQIEQRYSWRLLSCDLGDVMGRYPAVELAVGNQLGMEPRLPRRW